MPSPASRPRLQEQFRAVIRLHHYSIRTEKSYWYWIRYFIRFHTMRHPLEMGPAEVNAFLTWLAVERHVAAATQNQALNALVFLYARVLEKPLGEIGEVVRVKRPARIPTVFSHAEAMAVISLLEDPYRLLASLMYGAGLRVVEAARLRVKDLDFDRNVITVRDGKGAKDRTTLLPTPLIGALQQHKDSLLCAWKHQDPLYRSPVSLPFALRRKYPNANMSFEWQWLFTSRSLCVDEDGSTVRHHLHQSSIQKAVKAAIEQSALAKPASCHTFRHSFATELLRRGSDIRTVQTLLGHSMCAPRRFTPTCLDKHLPEYKARLVKLSGKLPPYPPQTGNTTAEKLMAWDDGGRPCRVASTRRRPWPGSEHITAPAVFLLPT